MPEKNVNALLSGNSWSSNVIGYFFADSLSDYRYRTPSFVEGFQPVGSAHQQAVRNILEGDAPSAPNGPSYMTLSSVEAVSNLSLYSTGNSPETIAIGQSRLLSRSMGYYPDPTFSDSRAGDVWLSKDITNVELGSFGYYTIMHELGHALGLKHGHEQDDTGNPVVLTPERDSIEFSVMTYRTYVGDQDLDDFDAQSTPQTLMMYDIAALQHLYGANFNTNNTDTVYNWSDTGSAYVNGVEVGKGSDIFLTIWDGGGIDTYDFSTFDDEMIIDLTPGSWSLFSRSDLAYLGDGHLARGNVFNALQYQNDPRSLIENAIGGDRKDTITGNAANNRLEGRYSDDTLSGGLGADTLDGGGENDWLDGGADGDMLIGGDGWDTVSYLSASDGITVDLATNQNGGAAYGDVLVDVESVRGSIYSDQLVSRDQGANLYGEIGDDYLIGRGGSDGLFGGGGNDALDGGGGNDTLWGGNGDDIIWGGAGADTLDGGHGIDTLDYIRSGSVYVDLRTGTTSGQAAGDVISNFENVIGGSGNDTLYGSHDSNKLNGQSGNDIIAGADGNDTLYGEAGNDLIEGGAGADTLNGGDGTDTLSYSDDHSGVYLDVRTNSAFYGLAEGDRIDGFENVIGGSGNDTVYGSLEDNVLSGQDGDDILAGADGQDILYGDIGNDWLEGGNGDDFIFGGSDDDRVVGGAGNDVLHGEAGRDLFVFESALNGTNNVDRIADFAVAEDWIGLSRSVFGGFGASVSLAVGASANAAGAQIVYDAATGALSYDADGTGAAAEVKFAQLAPGLALTAGNFVLI
ncbi:M10 family metallopeptidase C-terminal domain-containing protein [Microvirga sp. 2MCAF35]|uniref:M10 family metallopeptidase C-terminal domain-containing protein n=1 Tax=Microvirga sp. 2MCAF35 TaxID=3232987 RepID=UPI003F9727D2